MARQEVKGYIASSRNGHGRTYFYETEEEAWKDVNKNHPKYQIWKGEKILENGEIVRWVLRTLIKK